MVTKRAVKKQRKKVILLPEVKLNGWKLLGEIKSRTDFSLPAKPVKINNFAELQEEVEAKFGQDKEETEVKGKVIAYLDYKVLIGRFAENKFIFFSEETFDPKYLQKLRVFNKEKELYLWRQGENLFAMRLRVDGEGERVSVVEARQVLWGTCAEDLGNGWSRISESRGMELILPLTNLALDDKKNRVKLKTYNYIGYNEIGQAGYIDSRFVDFLTGGE